MLSARLVSIISFIINFTWVFLLSATIITIRAVFVYLSKMFDLPVHVIIAMRMIKTQDEDKNKKIQRSDID